MAEPVDPGGPAPALPGPPRRRRWLRRLAWSGFGLLAFLLLTVAAVWQLLHQHPRSLPWLLLQVPGLTVDGVQGTLADGQMQIRSLVWQPAGAGAPDRAGPRLQIDGLRLHFDPPRWNPFPGAWLSLHLPLVTADTLVWRSAPAGDTPLQRPADLRLPLALQIDALRIGMLQIDQQPPLTGCAARLALGDKRGTEHRIGGLACRWQQIELSGEAQIASQGSLALQAQLAARQLGQSPWTGQLALAGPIDAVQASLQWARQPTPPTPGQPAPPAVASAANLSAQATLRPFAAWPLGDLTLATQSLDLSSLQPHWPHTLISGQAQVQTQGLDRPAQARITLDNRLPGPWTAQALPVSRLVLQASATPRSPGQLAIEQLELTLASARAPAGVVRASGQWQGDQLQLDTQVSGLLPALLHPQAANLVLDGPIQLLLGGLALHAPGPAPRSAQAQAAPASTAAARPAPVAPSAPAAASPRLTLTVDARLSGRSLDSAGLPLALTLQASGDAQHILIRQARAQAGDARADLQVDARRSPAGWALQGQGQLARFDPRPWWRGGAASAWRRGPHRLDGSMNFDLLWRGLPPAAGPAAASGPAAAPLLERWLAALDGRAQAQITDSLLAGMPLAALARLSSAPGSAKFELQASLAGNTASAQLQRGAGAGSDRWQLQWQAPTLAALAPLGQLLAEQDPTWATLWPKAGTLAGSVSAQGRWPALQAQGELQAGGLQIGSLGLQAAQLSWTAGASADAPLSVRLQASGLSDGDKRLDQLSAGLSGSLRRHSLDLLVDSPAQPPAWTEDLLGPAGAGTRLQLVGQGAWSSQIDAGRPGADSPARLPGTWRLQDLRVQGGARDKQGGGSRAWLTAQGLDLALQFDDQGRPLSATLAPGQAQLLETALRWREAGWVAASAAQPAGFNLVADLERFSVSKVLARAQPQQGWGGDLTLAGRIEVRKQKNFDAELVLERLAGDLTLTDDLGDTQALGVSELRLALTAHDGLWQFAQGMAGRSLGEMAGAQVLRTDARLTWPAADAPLQGVVEARVANLGIWGTWVPPGWRLSGSLHTSASFSGTRSAPEVRGEMVGAGLGLRNVLQGVHVYDGDLALTLSGDSARIERFRFKGGDGSLTLSGQATLGAKPGATLTLQAERFRLLGRIDRRLVASGQAELRLDAQQLRLDGDFNVDEGLIDLSQSDAPRLDGDVRVRRGTAASDAAAAETQRAPSLPAPLRQPQVKLRIGLGQQLKLRGHGVETGLRGELAVTSPDGHLSLRGTVRTEGGSVAAYGQKLDIERGAVTFTGALDNPQIDLLAIRPNLDVRVGVQVSGAAQRPRIRLISEPELADYDKLSWLVLGRSPDGLGRTDTALLQRAALALLSGEGRSPTDALLESVGLTDFSVRQSDGDTRETIISLGKQLSRRWYLGYERSVNATTGTWQLVYRIAQRFTLRAQSGTDNALDLIWSWRW